jgi:hypothetical protein
MPSFIGSKKAAAAQLAKAAPAFNVDSFETFIGEVENTRAAAVWMADEQTDAAAMTPYERIESEARQAAEAGRLFLEALERLGSAAIELRAGPEGGDVIPVTVDTHWDCDCKENYIHPKGEGQCPICGADSETSPDSMRDEVAA